MCASLVRRVKGLRILLGISTAMAANGGFGDPALDSPAGSKAAFQVQHTVAENRPDAPQVAREVTLLGNPFLRETLWPTLLRYAQNPRKMLRNPLDPVALRYARNVWDMQLWQGTLYMGHGNSSNRGPATNAGPIPIVAYDLATGRFETEFTVDEEQIDRFRIIGNRLYIPGHDPRDSWDLGNFYRLNEGGWEKVRTIPLGIHTYDILAFHDTLFVAEGSKKGAMVSYSDDLGRTWKSVVLPGTPRAYTLFTLENILYVSAYKGLIFRYNSRGFKPVETDLFPDALSGRHPLVVRAAHLGQTLVYIGADRVNDHQWRPFAAYKAARIDAAQRLPLAPTDLPYDILVRDGRAYVLTNRPEDAGFTAIIYRSGDLAVWREVVRFSAPALARSFEYHAGVFYVGLGTDTASLHEASGNIYRVVPP